MEQMKPDETGKQKVTKIEAISLTKKHLRVAAYARVSTAQEDQLVSLKAQKRHYDAYIRQHPQWEYVGLYYDEGITGTSMDKRDGLKRLLSDCDNGLIDYIVVKSISRFSRNTVDCLETVRHLKEKGIYIFFEKENIDTGKMEGEMMLSILSGLAQSESRSISENVSWGVQRRFRNGTYRVGYPPYGYRNVDGEFKIDEEQAKVIRRIFDDVLSGKSTYQIAKELNQEGVRSRRGGRWESHVIVAMIRNEKYVGDMLLQKTYTDDQFKRHANHGQRRQFLVKDHHEPIVSRQVFEAANKIVEFNAAEKGHQKNGSGSKYQNRYAFSGKILCGKCHSKWKRRKIGSQYAYVCTGHLEDANTCPIKSIPEEKIEAAFLTMMNKVTAARSAILIPYKAMLKEVKQDALYDRINEIEERIESIDSKKLQILQLYTQGFLDRAVYEKELLPLVEEKRDLQQERDQLTRRINGDHEKEDALEKLLKYTSHGEVLATFDPDLLTEHVSHILVYDRNRIGFVMKCGPVFRERVD